MRREPPMSAMRWLAVSVLSIACVAVLHNHLAYAQNPDCRQSWMPPDAPAFCGWQTEPSLPEGRTYHAVAARRGQRLRTWRLSL